MWLLDQGFKMIRRHKKALKLCLIFSVACVFLIIVYGVGSRSYAQQIREFKFTYPNKYFKQKDEKKIILWTEYFHSKWSLQKFQHCLQTCPAKCTLTDDKAEIRNVDAVVFHLTDMWTKNWVIGTKSIVELPEYRAQDQVWVVSNMEPPPHLFGNLRILNGLFNLTMWYRSDSDIVLYYGKPNKLNDMERAKAMAKVADRNYFQEKTAGVSLRISNCFDPGRRYKIIGKLEKYIPLDKYGKCYGQVCGNPVDPFDESCDKLMRSYKFYLAFENDNCKDYITEKYWATLSRDVIPIVNWKNISPDVVIPNSYINIYDFDTLEQAADYIKKVGANETLYNSYFEYKKYYNNYHGKCDMCRLCEALHDADRPATVHTDLEGWVRDDICEKVEVSKHSFS